MIYYYKNVVVLPFFEGLPSHYHSSNLYLGSSILLRVQVVHSGGGGGTYFSTDMRKAYNKKFMHSNNKTKEPPSSVENVCYYIGVQVILYWSEWWYSRLSASSSGKETTKIISFDNGHVDYYYEIFF